MVGKGSVNHNSRKFKAENVDGERSHFNIDYCNENIKKVYHKLFDEALQRYNEKQTRSDRRIDNYYEKIRNSKQEKPFHELILQIGDKENMGAGSENGNLARQVLDEYYQQFQKRNPNLYVFSAHLHMDEATPHLHIDFVPFTTGSKRGLDTRVSLKQALAKQGFKGGSRGDTAWSQWVQSEKEQLSAVMEQHGIEWEHKGTHEKHLSVLDYKKQEREKEVVQLEGQILEKKEEFQILSDRVENYDKGIENLKTLEQVLDILHAEDSEDWNYSVEIKERFMKSEINQLKKSIEQITAESDKWHSMYADTWLKHNDEEISGAFSEFQSFKEHTEREIDLINKQKRKLKVELKSGHIKNTTYQRTLTPLNKQIDALELKVRTRQHELFDQFLSAGISYCMIESYMNKKNEGWF